MQAESGREPSVLTERKRSGWLYASYRCRVVETSLTSSVDWNLKKRATGSQCLFFGISTKRTRPFGIPSRPQDGTRSGSSADLHSGLGT